MNNDVLSAPNPLTEAYNHSKLYPVWTNAIYGLLAIYALLKSLFLLTEDQKGDDNFFSIRSYAFFIFLFSILSGCACGVSVHYHLNTPSWTTDETGICDTECKEALNKDTALSIALSAYSILVIVMIILANWKNNKCSFLNLEIVLIAICIIFSVVCFFIATEYSKKAKTDCVKEENKIACFKNISSVYNIYHSTWHLFTGFAGFFWVIYVYNSSKIR